MGHVNTKQDAKDSPSFAKFKERVRKREEQSNKTHIRECVDEYVTLLDSTKKNKYSIVEDFYHGMPLFKLSQKYKLKQSAIFTVLHSSGVIISDDDRKRRNAEIVRLYQNENQTEKTVAEICGVDEMTISRALKAAGIHIRGRRGSKKSKTAYNL